MHANKGNPVSTGTEYMMGNYLWIAYKFPSRWGPKKLLTRNLPAPFGQMDMSIRYLKPLNSSKSYISKFKLSENVSNTMEFP